MYYQDDKEQIQENKTELEYDEDDKIKYKKNNGKKVHKKHNQDEDNEDQKKELNKEHQKDSQEHGIQSLINSFLDKFEHKKGTTKRPKYKQTNKKITKRTTKKQKFDVRIDEIGYPNKIHQIVKLIDSYNDLISNFVDDNRLTYF